MCERVCTLQRNTATSMKQTQQQIMQRTQSTQYTYKVIKKYHTHNLVKKYNRHSILPPSDPSTATVGSGLEILLASNPQMVQNRSSTTVAQLGHTHEASIEASGLPQSVQKTSSPSRAVPQEPHGVSLTSGAAAPLAASSVPQSTQKTCSSLVEEEEHWGQTRGSFRAPALYFRKSPRTPVSTSEATAAGDGKEEVVGYVSLPVRRPVSKGKSIDYFQGQQGEINFTFFLQSQNFVIRR